MRTFVTMAALLMLPWGLSGNWLYGGDLRPSHSQKCGVADAQCGAEGCAEGCAEAIRAVGFNTSVVPLKHSHARQIIPAVKAAVARSIASSLSGQQESKSVTVILIPTTANDSLVAICPAEHAEATKHAIEQCDIAPHYVVKAQIFAVCGDGEPVPISSPSLIVGREGTVKCATSTGEDCLLTFKVNGAPVDADSAHEAAEASCNAGRAHVGCSADSCKNCPNQASKCQGCAAECPGCAKVSRQLTEKGRENSSCCPNCDEEVCECGANAAASQCSKGDVCPKSSAAQSDCSFKCEQVSSATSNQGEAEESDRRCTECELTSVTPGAVCDWLVAGLQCLKELITDDPALVAASGAGPAGERCHKSRASVCCQQEDELILPAESTDHRKSSGCIDLTFDGRHIVIHAGNGHCPSPVIQSGALSGGETEHEETAELRGIEVVPRRLNDVFNSHSCQEPFVNHPGRLLAEIAKSNNDAGATRPRGVIVVEFPDRIRIFEDAEAHSQHRTIPACPNCREEFGAVLEELLGTSNVSGVTPTGNETEANAANSPRELPAVTHSKIETTVVTYPLRDLVLLDDEGRPVFDTCTIIDHLEAAVAPGTWSHPSVSIQLDQQSVSLIIRQTPDVHQQVESHLRYLRRLQVKQICNLIERLSVEPDSTLPAAPSSETESP